MKFLATAALIAAIAAVLAPSVGAGSSGVTVASGSFTLRQGGGVNRTFAFTVIQLPSGEVTGQAEINAFPTGLLAHISINCFQLVGNQAIIGGITTQSTDPEAVGVSRVFAIEDNPDLSTFVFANSAEQEPLTCANLLEQLRGTGFEEPDLSSLLKNQGVPVETGNIMIQHAN
jgi:hypothetical protein